VLLIHPLIQVSCLSCVTSGGWSCVPPLIFMMMMTVHFVFFLSRIYLYLCMSCILLFVYYHCILLCDCSVSLSFWNISSPVFLSHL
jgi:hypothetical protein